MVKRTCDNCGDVFTRKNLYEAHVKKCVALPSDDEEDVSDDEFDPETFDPETPENLRTRIALRDQTIEFQRDRIRRLEAELDSLNTQMINNGKIVNSNNTIVLECTGGRCNLIELRDVILKILTDANVCQTHTTT